MPQIGPLADWADVIAYLRANPERARLSTDALRALSLERSQAKPVAQPVYGTLPVLNPMDDVGA